MKAASLGFRVKAGWATTVLVGGPPASPQVLDHGIVQLSAPALPASGPPFHGGTGEEGRDGRRVARRVAGIRRFARRSVADLIKRYRAAGHRLRGVAVVAGSDIEPERIANPHIRAHAQEGKLFRTVLEDGARRAGLRCGTLLERDLFTQAAEALGRPAPDLQRAVTALGGGRGRAGRWRAGGKAARRAAGLVRGGNGGGGRGG